MKTKESGTRSKTIDRPNILSNLNITITAYLREHFFSFFARVFSDRDFKDKARILIYNGIFSFLCAYITDDKVLTAVYIGFTILLSLTAISWKHKTKKSNPTSRKKLAWLYWPFFGIVAVLPALIRFVLGNQNGGFEWSYEFGRNLTTNLFGALTMCSILRHTSKYGKEWLKESPDTSLVENLLLICFNAAFLNAVNYTQNSIDPADIANAVHLF